MTESAFTEWKRMKAIELRIRSVPRRGDAGPLQTELYEAVTAFASAFKAEPLPPPTPRA